jgi:hypothetical protein
MDDQNPTTLSTITANSQERASQLSFVPTGYTEEGHHNYLCAYFGEDLI